MCLFSKRREYRRRYELHQTFFVEMKLLVYSTSSNIFAQEIDGSGAKMTQLKHTDDVLEKLKYKLLAEREKVLADFEIQTGDLHKTTTDQSGDLSTSTYHMADMGTDMQEREITSIFAHRESKYLTEIDAALDSIENGSYGICEICKALIEPERLLAVPIAKYHVSCKETANQRKNNR